jgi:hypothetical protein
VQRKKANLQFLIFLAFCLLLSCVLPVVLQAEEPDNWFLISETELQSIERYKASSEREKQSWLLQVQKSQETADRLQASSTSLNSQLSQAREQNRRLEQSFNEYEAEQLARLSMKNGEIVDLKAEAANEKLGKEKYRGKYTATLIAAIALAGAWVVFIAAKIYRRVMLPMNIL